MNDRNTLLQQIGEISFTINDLTLYLDTHPLDTNAMDYFNRNMAQRKQLMKTYANEFGPLTMDCVCTESNNSSDTDTTYAGQKHWTWSDGPVPWDNPANPVSAKGGAI